MAKNNKAQAVSNTSMSGALTLGPDVSSLSASPIEGMSREEFFMIFSAFIAAGQIPSAAYKLTKKEMPAIIRALESGN